MIALLFVVTFLSALKMAYNGVRSLVLGCGRRFQKGRKCALNCPNSADCPFSKYFKDPNYAPVAVEEKEVTEND